MAIKKQMNIFAPSSYDPDKNILEKLRNSKDIGLFIGDGKYIVTVKPTENPDEKGSFGFIGVFVHVSSIQLSFRERLSCVSVIID